MTDECEREDEDLTVDEISALRWTKPAHLNLIGIEKAAASIRLLATRLLEEIARANEAEAERVRLAKLISVRESDWEATKTRLARMERLAADLPDIDQYAVKHQIIAVLRSEV